MNDTAL